MCISVNGMSMRSKLASGFSYMSFTTGYASAAMFSKRSLNCVITFWNVSSSSFSRDVAANSSSVKGHSMKNTLRKRSLHPS